jgi:hypothetical protein
MAAHRKIEKTTPSRFFGTRALPIGKFAEQHGIHPCTVWRAVKEGRLEYVVVGKRKLILPPPVQRVAVD